MEELNFSTGKRYQLLDITADVEKAVEKSGAKDGSVLVFAPHSTACVILTENEDGLKNDWLEFFKKLVSGFDFKHNQIDDNADSHILAGFVGQSKVLPIKNGRPILGTWQQIFLAEFDGPRNRKIIVEIMK